MKRQFNDPLAWRGVFAPSLGDLEAMAADACARLQSGPLASMPSFCIAFGAR